jgi:hypothetical protein
VLIMAGPQLLGLLPSAPPATTPPGPASSTLAAGFTPSLAPPSPSPTDSVIGPLMAAFWNLIEDPRLSYHLAGSGKSVYQGQQLERFTLDLDISGDDYAGRVDTIGGSGKARLVRVNGVVYVRPAGGNWVSRPTSDPGLRQAPFMGVATQSAVVYDSQLQQNGKTLYRLVSTATYQPSIARMLDLASFNSPTDLVSLVLTVNANGVPQHASFRCAARGVDATGNPQFVGTADYDFSAFGTNYTISAP